MVDVKTFAIQNADSSELVAIRAVALQNQAVKAVSINSTDNLIGVTYELEHINSEEVTQLLSMDGTYQVSIKTLSQNGPSCPVQGVMEFWEKALALHRIVD